MKTLFVPPSDPTIKQISELTFPEYRGKKFQLRIIPPDQKIRLHNYWDEGSRAYPKAIDLLTFRVFTPREYTSNFFSAAAHAEFSLPENIAIVEHLFVCGKDEGIVITVREENAAKMLPGDMPELSRDERIVLVATRSLKASYAGLSNYRFYEARRQTGITQARWDAAKARLVERGYLDKRGALTVAGKNTASNLGTLWDFR